MQRKLTLEEIEKETERLTPKERLELVENKTSLLSQKPYRAECWQISHELAGSISQIQKTVQKAIESIRTRLDIETDAGEPTGETVSLYQPRACSGSFIASGSIDFFP